MYPKYWYNYKLAFFDYQIANRQNTFFSTLSLNITYWRIFPHCLICDHI
uniref:Cytochrome P450 7 n=1 Tax=Streltzoviella insularis TaxID=1206366 RepID=A0A7D5UMS2_9NEOP|nr:cytochrome P450 7 [Streltzoviella insularis]